MSANTSTAEMYPVSDAETRFYPTLRSIFYAYPDPTSKAANYHPSLWINAITRGDMYQAIAVMDIPAGVPPGDYRIEVDGVGIDIEIIPGVGQPNQFRDIWSTAQDITNLEPAPQKQIVFDVGYTVGAIDMQVAYDDIAIAASEINVVAFDINQGSGTFGDFQSMLFWRETGGQLSIGILCPAGVASDNIRLAIVYPVGVANPGISILSMNVVDLNGVPVSGIQAYLN